MITCPTCGTEHVNLKLRRGESIKCSGLKSGGKVCGQTLTHRNLVYNDKKYDRMDFMSVRPKVKPKVCVVHVGRSKSAPPMINWPFPAMSTSVTYVAHTTLSTAWAAPASTDILLPFTALNVLSIAPQGLIINCPVLGHTPSARAHFDAITVAMTTPKKSQDVTEAVGEAAAAMAVMTLHPGYVLLWGFDVHSGAGIDQIWCDMDPNHPHFLVVEAKGPTACLGSGALGNPVGYEQMEKLWVVDRLARMRSGVGQTLADTILDKLALDIHIALPNYGGASKSYYGCSATPGKAAVGRLSGLTVTALWQGDAMLAGQCQTHAYTFP